MKNIYFKLPIIFINLFYFSGNLSAQTTLVAGDLAFTGYHATPNAPQNDAFSFVLLRSVSLGTVIRFTENGWGNDLVFRPGENTVSLTTTAALAAGQEITIAGQPSGVATATLRQGGSAGTIAGTMLSLSVNGDQVIAYQSVVAGTAPFTFISAINMNVYVTPGDPSTTDVTNWDNLAAASNTTNSSFKPTGLTTGTNCIWIGTQGSNASERNNARFNCATAIAGGANLTTAAGARAACNNQAFWDAEFAASGAVPTWPLPSGCNFFNLLPIKLTSFEGKLNPDRTATLIWEVSEQTGINKFIVEKSPDGINYSPLGEVSASNRADDNYSFKDLTLSAGLNYYRLMISELSGKTSHSAVVKLNNKGSVVVSVYPNPVTNMLYIDQISNPALVKTATLLNNQGQVLQNIVIRKKLETIDMRAYAPGIYLIRMDDGNVYRIFKQ